MEVARCGCIRKAAKEFCLSEEGMRRRLLGLEESLGFSVYEKERGRRTNVRLTHAGQVFLNKAIRFIEEAQALTKGFEPGQPRREIKIAASQYLVLNLLVDIVRDFHDLVPDVVVRLCTRTEQQVVSIMRTDSSFAAGICAPEEFPTDLACRRWFSMVWHLVASLENPLLERPSVTLTELAEEPLIVFEPGTTGRQHVLEAFYRRDITPRIVAEVTSTHVAVRMAEAGMGSAIIPVLSSGFHMWGKKLGQVRVSDPIRMIENVVLSSSTARADPTTQMFLDFVLRYKLSSVSECALYASADKPGRNMPANDPSRERPEYHHSSLAAHKSELAELRPAVSR